MRVLPAGAAYVAPLFLVMLLAFNLPIVLMLSWSVAAPPDMLTHYGQIFERAVYLKVLGNTFRISLIATAVCVVFGYPLAYWMSSRLEQRSAAVDGHRSGDDDVLGISILVRTYAWIVMLGNGGILNRWLQSLGIVSAARWSFSTMRVVWPSA